MAAASENAERSNHYGMIIMRDRAQKFARLIAVRRRETGGTEGHGRAFQKQTSQKPEEIPMNNQEPASHPVNRRPSDATHGCKSAY